MKLTMPQPINFESVSMYVFVFLLGLITSFAIFLTMHFVNNNPAENILTNIEIVENNMDQQMNLGLVQNTMKGK